MHNVDAGAPGSKQILFYPATMGWVLTIKIGTAVQTEIGLGDFFKMQIWLHHCVDLVETIEIHI